VGGLEDGGLKIASPASSSLRNRGGVWTGLLDGYFGRHEVENM
jgi:hypothetical protein